MNPTTPLPASSQPVLDGAPPKPSVRNDPFRVAGAIKVSGSTAPVVTLRRSRGSSKRAEPGGAMAGQSRAGPPRRTPGGQGRDPTGSRAPPQLPQGSQEARPGYEIGANRQAQGTYDDDEAPINSAETGLTLIANA